MKPAPSMSRPGSGAWLHTPSDTAALLICVPRRDGRPAGDVALKLLDAVVKLRPIMSRAGTRRATLYYLKNDYAHRCRIRAGAGPRAPPFRRLAGLGMISRISATRSARSMPSQGVASTRHMEKVPELVKP